MYMTVKYKNTHDTRGTLHFSVRTDLFTTRGGPDTPHGTFVSCKTPIRRKGDVCPTDRQTDGEYDIREGMSIPDLGILHTSEGKEGVGL